MDGAMDGLVRHKVDRQDIDTAWTPGALEIPLVAQKLASTGRYNAIVCLGAVIRGGTPHFDYVATELSKGIAKISLDSGLPVINGVITADNLEQAIERAGSKMGNKGFTAASSAIEMANLVKVLG
jgi:6,7-dimethyl-8-ribityllumazine synthase